MLVMQVLILGAGALGSLLGARLLATDARVTLFSTNREHIQSTIPGIWRNRSTWWCCW
jgi:ketopantoate reductase